MFYAIVSLLLFLIRCRYPENESIFSVTRRRYGVETTKDLRKWERTARQAMKAEQDEVLLRRCYSDRIVPKFLKFRLYRQNLSTSPVYRECQDMLLRNEIDYKRKLYKKLSLICENLKRKVKETVGWMDFVHFQSFVDRGVSLYKVRVVEIHKRKFVSWGGSYNPTNISSDRCIFNFSRYVLNDREKFLLSLGLNFSIPCFTFPKKDLLLYFENMLHRLKNHPIFGTGDFREVVNECKTVLGKLPKVFRYSYNMITKADIDILKKLKSQNNLTICKPDKGIGTVLLDKDQYLEKMNSILMDNTKFKKMGNADIFKVNLSIEDKINYQLRKLKKDNIISETEYNELYVSGSSPSVMYGLPKVHKEGIPLRPILAAFKSPSSKLAKFLTKIIQPLTSNQYTVTNSYEFKEIISDMSFPQGVCLASFDITSLFTNVPVQETVEILLNELYEGQDTIRNLTKQQFKKLLELCIGDNHFIFNQEIYKQHEGFAMGSPLSAPLANIFLCHHELNG